MPVRCLPPQTVGIGAVQHEGVVLDPVDLVRVASDHVAFRKAPAATLAVHTSGCEDQTHCRAHAFREASLSAVATARNLSPCGRVRVNGLEAPVRVLEDDGAAARTAAQHGARHAIPHETSHFLGNAGNGRRSEGHRHEQGVGFVVHVSSRERRSERFESMVGTKKKRRREEVGGGGVRCGDGLDQTFRRGPSVVAKERRWRMSQALRIATEVPSSTLPAAAWNPACAALSGPHTPCLSEFADLMQCVTRAVDETSCVKPYGHLVACLRRHGFPEHVDEGGNERD